MTHAHIPAMAGSRETRPRVTAAALDAPAGGGGFAFDRVSLGVFLVDQPRHRIALGSDRPVERPLSAGEGWILPAGAEGVCAFDSAHRFLTVEIDAAALREAGLDDARGFEPRFGAQDPLLTQMARLAAEPPPGAPNLYLETMRQALSAHLAQKLRPAPVAAAGIDDHRLRRAVAYIHDRLAEDFSLDALAAEAAMSPFHFSRAFKRATGRSPLQYVIAERLALAKALLKTSRAPVAEIAHRVGYEDVSRFGKHFKRAYGVTPAAARA